MSLDPHFPGNDSLPFRSQHEAEGSSQSDPVGLPNPRCFAQGSCSRILRTADEDLISHRGRDQHFGSRYL